VLEKVGRMGTGPDGAAHAGVELTEGLRTRHLASPPRLPRAGWLEQRARPSRDSSHKSSAGGTAAATGEGGEPIVVTRPILHKRLGLPRDIREARLGRERSRSPALPTMAPDSADASAACLTSVGRSEQCDITIPDARISRQHARLIVRPDGCILEDLKTSNGTLVNGVRIDRTRLSDGDRIRLADCELVFSEGESSAPPGSPGALDGTGASVISSVDISRPSEGVQDATGSPAVSKLKSHLKVVQDVSESACGAFAIEALTEWILEQLLRVFPQAAHAHAALFGLGGGGEDLYVSAARQGRAEVGISHTLLELSTSQKRAILAEDAPSDDRFRHAASIIGQELRSMMCCPLVIRDRVLGAIQVDSTELGRPFTMDDLRLLVTVGGRWLWPRRTRAFTRNWSPGSGLRPSERRCPASPTASRT